MEVSKKQITEGVCSFLENCLIPSVSDGQTKLVLTMVKSNLKKNPDMADDFLDNPMISSVIKEDDGMYDVTPFVQAMKDVFEENDYYPITIPGVPLISPQPKTIKISESYFDKLTRYITPDPATDDDE